MASRPDRFQEAISTIAAPVNAITQKKRLSQEGRGLLGSGANGWVRLKIVVDTRTRTLTVERKSLPLAHPFRISGHVFTSSDVIQVTLSDGTHVGRGEAAGVYYLGDGAPEMLAGCWIGVDANQGFDIGDLDALIEALVAQDVRLLEQPLARGREADLDGYGSPIPIAADESVLTLADVAGTVGRFQVINIKLDKCGGLTEGLEMARAALASARRS